MKATYLIIAMTLIGLYQLSACGETYDETGTINNNFTLNSEFENESSNSYLQFIDQFQRGELSEEEINGLQFMREEEKLARDVYLTLYEKWALFPFKNISKSEQAHMDAILTLLNKYDLDDPAEGNEIGIFTNEELQKLYHELIEQGSKSAVDALKVGALIEEVDIMDLQRIIDEDVDNEDIEFVLSNLKRASGFHLKAFVGHLSRYNIEYSPELLDENIFIDIIQ